MKKSRIIPYQKCPVCEGTKRVWVSQYDPYNTASTVGWQVCSICNGVGIIPMFILPKEPSSKNTNSSPNVYNKKWGLNFEGIPACIIPFTEKVLEDCDVIENINGVQLIYKKNIPGYLLITKSPNEFLSEDQIFSKWKKV